MEKTILDMKLLTHQQLRRDFKMEKLHRDEEQIVRDFGGSETCSYCGLTTNMNSMIDKCEHCGEWILCCSQCFRENDCSECFWSKLVSRLNDLKGTIDKDFNSYVTSTENETKEWTDNKFFKRRYVVVAFMGALRDCLFYMLNGGRKTKTVEQLIKVVGKQNIFYSLFDFWLGIDEDYNIFNYDDMENIIDSYIEKYR